MSQSEFKVTIGADPELFLISKKTGEYVSAHGKIPGTKAQPYPVEYGAVQVDGNAVEFNIDPATTAKEFLRNVTQVKRQLTEMLPDFDLVATPYVEFSKSEWDSLPESAKELGCDPDYNAYSGGKNSIPNLPNNFKARTTGGHIHVGWTSDVDPFDPNHLEACKILVKELDFFLLEPVCFLANDAREFHRRDLYGRAGAFRPKHYGVEYRSPSSYWVTKDDLIMWVFSQTKKVFNDLLSGKFANQQSYQVELSKTLGAYSSMYAYETIVDYFKKSNSKMSRDSIRNYLYNDRNKARLLIGPSYLSSPLMQERKKIIETAYSDVVQAIDERLRKEA